MASDRFIYWVDGKAPSREDVAHVIEDYFGDWLKKVDREDSSLPVFFITLVGKYSMPLRRIPGAHSHSIPPDDNWNGRFIEVWFHPHGINVLTRQQDEATNVLADGLVAIFKRFWSATTTRG